MRVKRRAGDARAAMLQCAAAHCTPRKLPPPPVANRCKRFAGPARPKRKEDTFTSRTPQTATAASQSQAYLPPRAAPTPTPAARRRTPRVAAHRRAPPRTPPEAAAAAPRAYSARTHSHARRRRTPACVASLPLAAACRHIQARETTCRSRRTPLAPQAAARMPLALIAAARRTCLPHAACRTHRIPPHADAARTERRRTPHAAYRSQRAPPHAYCHPHRMPSAPQAAACIACRSQRAPPHAACRSQHTPPHAACTAPRRMPHAAARRTPLAPLAPRAACRSHRAPPHAVRRHSPPPPSYAAARHCSPPLAAAHLAARPGGPALYHGPHSDPPRPRAQWRPAPSIQLGGGPPVHLPRHGQEGQRAPWSQEATQPAGPPARGPWPARARGGGSWRPASGGPRESRAPRATTATPTADGERQDWMKPRQTGSRRGVEAIRAGQGRAGLRGGGIHAGRAQRDRRAGGARAQAESAAAAAARGGGGDHWAAASSAARGRRSRRTSSSAAECARCAAASRPGTRRPHGAERDVPGGRDAVPAGPPPRSSAPAPTQELSPAAAPAARMARTSRTQPLPTVLSSTELPTCACVRRGGGDPAAAC
jgi:hypothetical protein